MSSKATPNLTGIVEAKFLSLIDNEEIAAFGEKKQLSSLNYVKLADLYHFHKDFEKEEQILTRFSESPFANNEDLMDIYERIERVSKTRYVLHGTPVKKSPPKLNSAPTEKEKNSELDELSLIAIDSEPNIVEISSNDVVTHRHKETKLSLEEQTITVLALSSIYTGRTDEDELLELSLVLLEYSAKEETPFNIKETFIGNRKPVNKLSDKEMNALGIDVKAHDKRPMKKDRVISLFAKADYVVSHKEPSIERRMVITLFPELLNAKWHSTQQDIPWRAMGFDSTNLSDIMPAFGRSIPRTSLDRAKAISHILQSNEPNNSDLYIERIHYMNPMKAQEWTKEMNRQHKRMQGNSFLTKVGLIGGVILLIVVCVFSAHYLGFL